MVDGGCGLVEQAGELSRQACIMHAKRQWWPELTPLPAKSGR